jgi:hypothetical protein
MATPKTKKTKPKHRLRNAATARALPRAVVVRPKERPASHVDAEPDQRVPLARTNTPGWRTFKAVGGALVTSVAGAYLARQDLVPPKIAAGAISAAGALLALEGPEFWKPLGLGAMSAAGGLLSFMLIDNELIKFADDKDKKQAQESAASKPPAPAPTKRQASDIPADALARAFERARLRMALSSDTAN